jgi:hypothetical protein
MEGRWGMANMEGIPWPWTPRIIADGSKANGDPAPRGKMVVPDPGNVIECGPPVYGLRMRALVGEAGCCFWFGDG